MVPFIWTHSQTCGAGGREERERDGERQRPKLTESEAEPEKHTHTLEIRNKKRHSNLEFLSEIGNQRDTERWRDRREERCREAEAGRGSHI